MLREAKKLYLQKSAEVRYIILNSVVFLLITISASIDFLTNSSFDLSGNWLSVPADLGSLMYKPWTIASYMFAHKGLFHLIFNMVFLYFSARIFVDLLGEDKFIKTYWIGGLAGAVLFVFAYNVFSALSPENAVMLGASASVYSVFIAIAVIAPNYLVSLPLIGPARLKYIAIVFVVLSLPLTQGNVGGHVAHFGGLLWGFLWAYYIKKGVDIGSWFDPAYNWVRSIGSKSKSEKYSTKKGGKKSKTKSVNVNSNQEEIDRILDKIGKSGYDSLSKEEKDLLFKASK